MRQTGKQNGRYLSNRVFSILDRKTTSYMTRQYSRRRCTESQPGWHTEQTLIRVRRNPVARATAAKSPAGRTYWLTGVRWSSSRGLRTTSRATAGTSLALAVATQCRRHQLPQARSALDAEPFNDAELTRVFWAVHSTSLPARFHFHHFCRLSST